MWLPGAASTALRPLLGGRGRPARWLGVTHSALYLSLTEPPVQPAAGDRGCPGGVLIILARDAARLPCGLRLATTSAELPLTALAPASSGPGPAARAGGGRVEWAGPAGPVVISVASEWAPVRLPRGAAVVAGALERARAAAGSQLPGIGQPLLDALGETAVPSAGHPAGARPGAATLADGAVAGLLGRGPGLTPSGDDVLAGFLAGAWAFGLAVPGVRQAVARRAPGATTALSGQLLRHAADGECISELAELAWALTGHGEPATAARRLLAVGHSSGAALAAGLLLAAGRSRPAAVGPDVR